MRKYSKYGDGLFDRLRLAGRFSCLLVAFLLSLFFWSPAAKDKKSATASPVTERFASADADETPSFQRHVVPLFGRLGCNGRACHGSFQGRGGFRLSLFGYDFKADHEALFDKESPRVDVESPLDSLILIKPTDEDMHEGGLRYKKDGWEYHVFRRWIEAGAKFDASAIEKLVALEVTPSEIVFEKEGQTAQLRAVAVWQDGSREDVTPLCRFQSNSDQVADISEDGLVTAKEPGDSHVVAFYDQAVVPVPVIRPVSKFAGENYPSVPAPTKIDQLVVQKLRKLGVVPSDFADDAEFLRRIRLDLTGTLPSPQEVEKFLADKSPNKRLEKINQLLETPEYAAWWTTKLCDFTGNNAQSLVNATPMRNSASEEWYNWIYKRVAENTPYDQLAEGMVLAVSRNEGQTYTEYCKEMSELYRDGSEMSFADRNYMPHYWARRNFTRPEERTIGFAYAFLGIRIQCAQCHKHPFDQWSKQDFEDFQGFFTNVNFGRTGARDARDEYNELVEALGIKGKRGNEVRRALPQLLKEGKTIPFPEVYAVQPRSRDANRNNRNRRNRGGNGAAKARLLGGEMLDLTQYEDSRQPLMEWLRDKDNPYFARAFVNRVWASYFNVGIVEPPDDMSLANPPSNKPLLDYLAEGFVESGYDMKWLHREIASSRTYQLTWRPNETNANDQRNFSRSVPRRLPAEVAYDAIQLATASDEAIAKMHSELDGRAISIPGAGYRNRGNNGAQYALTIFGRSTRESNCDCDRSSEASLLQTVYLQNDRDVLSMIDRRDGFVNQIDRQLRGGRATNDRDNRGDGELQAIERQIAQIESRLENLRKKNRKEQIERAEKFLENLRKRKNRLSPKREQKNEKEVKIADNKTGDKIDPAELARQAYLRTLSRYPTEQELDRSTKFIEGSEDQVAGVRGLMWALLNTKEFIVNR